MELSEALAQYENLHLFKYDNYTVIFRCLSWKDYKIFLYLFKQYPLIQVDLEDQIWNLCVVEHNFPAGLDYIDAGIITNIARLVMYFSGRSLYSKDNVALLQQDLEEARASRDTLEGQIKLAILEAFPSYKLEDLDDRPWTKLMELLAYSENLLKKDFSFNLKEESEVDDSKQVFDMLDDFSLHSGSGVLDIDDSNE